jgi:hypothetical protein
MNVEIRKVFRLSEEFHFFEGVYFVFAIRQPLDQQQFLLIILLFIQAAFYYICNKRES